MNPPKLQAIPSLDQTRTWPAHLQSSSLQSFFRDELKKVGEVGEAFLASKIPNAKKTSQLAKLSNIK